MKYLLILLFLFSTHSFSGEADGKGLSCIMQKYTYDKKEAEVHFWLNNGKVAYISAFEDYVEKKKIIIFPTRKKLSAKFANEYEVTSNTISWKTPNKIIHTLNRKSLELTITKPEYYNYSEDKTMPAETVKGICKVFEGFRQVKKIQNQMIKKIKEKNLRRKEDEIKAREGNKI